MRMLNGKFPKVPQNQLEMLSISVPNEEIMKAIFYMKPYKALGPDGYQPFFYHDQWRMVGPIVCNFIKDIFQERINVAVVNQSQMVLISNVQSPEYMHQFRPIGLCNVSFKIIPVNSKGGYKSLL